MLLSFLLCHIYSLYGYFCISSLDIIRILLTYPKIDPNVKNNKDRTPLQEVIINGYEDYVPLLLSFPNIDINHKDQNGNTALQLAKKHKRYYSMTLLMDD